MKITRKGIQFIECIHNCLELIWLFLRQLFQIPRGISHCLKEICSQLLSKNGKLTIFSTLSTNIDQQNLLKLLFKVKSNAVEILDEDINLMHYIDVSILINEVVVPIVHNLFL